MPTHDARCRWLGSCLIGLAMALAALGVLGALVIGAIHWRVRPIIRDQLYGLDALSLAIAAPLAAVAGTLALRRRALGALLGFAPAAYVVYMVPQYVLGPEYTHLPGDNERWFPLPLMLFVLGVVCVGEAWSGLASAVPAVASRRERTIGRRLLPLAASVVFIRYLPTLADWMSTSPTAKEYLAGPTFGWTIALLDLGLALPATVAVCVGYRHGAAWARRGLYALAGWFALVGAAVAAMAIAMQLRHDPAMSPPQMALMTALGAILVALAIALYRPILRSRPEANAAFVSHTPEPRSDVA